MRKNYFELLKNIEIDPAKELTKLKDIFSERVRVDCVRDQRSLYDFVSDNFKLYRNRENFLSLEELLEYSNSITKAFDHISRFFYYSEMYIDLLTLLKPNIYYELDAQAKCLIEQIAFVINKLNHKFQRIDGSVIVVESNTFANEAAQITSEYTSVKEALSILEYNHYANKGNIIRKREILIKIAALLEPWRESLNTNVDFKDVLKCGNNNKIVAVEKLFRMYNEMNIRHNNDKQKLDSLSEQEIEAWYDKIYTMSLFVILGKDVSQILSDFKAFDVES